MRQHKISYDGVLDWPFAAAADPESIVVKPAAKPDCIQQQQRPRYATPEEARIAMEQQQYGYDL